MDPYLYYWYDNLVDGDPGAAGDDWGDGWQDEADEVVEEAERTVYGFLLTRFPGKRTSNWDADRS